ncbi:MAG: DNA-3-methyladenine glycosylase [Rhodothermales bacterium]|nr:DNA-3-methyladenine glycosylase [Rhodothermales bacterium]MDG2017402.1 DNA-3-methyladenine glycosylase [Rhodothermales bacterium]
MKPLPYSVFDAIQHLSAADETMAALIHSIGPYEGGLRPADSPFEALCEAVAYQQLSGKAAATIYGRFRSLTDESRSLDPLLVSKLSEEQLRGCGLSRAKSAAIQDLSAKTLEGVVPGDASLAPLSDQDIIDRLISVRGIGPWSVKMYLMFRLGRPDVLPQTDLGIRKGVMRTYGLPKMPTPKQVIVLAEDWRPFRTLASWYLWRSLELDQ